MKKLLACFLAAFVLLLANCSDSDGLKSVNSFDSELAEASTEFQYNYTFLYYRYYLAEEELDEPSTYLESPLRNYIKEKYASVSDVFAMYYSMSDLLTNYYPHEVYDNVSTVINTSASANKRFGMEWDSTYTVKYVYREGPAKSAGILRGDKILAVNNVEINANDSVYKAVIADTTSDTFKWTMLRGKDTLDFSMTRVELNLPTVYVDSVGNIPVIKVTEFTNQTNGFTTKGTLNEFEEALRETEGAKSTVLDLRGNGGGTIELCSGMAADLLSEGDTIVREKIWGKNTVSGKRDTVIFAYTAQTDGIGKGRYYVLMLDSSSASCTELFAVALTSNLKTPIVGTNSFGKGIGQVYATTPDKGWAAATAYLFSDKDGVVYHRHGFDPDYDIPNNPDSALSVAVKLAKEGKVKRTAGYSADVQPYWKRSKLKASEKSTPNISDLKRGLAFEIQDPFENP